MFIIKVTKPKVYMVENPDNYSWEYIHKYIGGGYTYSLYEQVGLFSLRAKEVLSKKRDIWFKYKTETEKLCDRQKWKLYKRFKRQEWFYFKRLWDRSKIPELALKDFFEQAISYIEKGGELYG